MIFQKVDEVFYLWAQKATDILYQGESGERKEKIMYAVSYVLMEIVKIVTLLTFFWASNRLKNFLICMITLVSLRRYMGGFHRKTILGCEMQAVINFLIIIHMGENINILQWKYVVYIVSVLLIWRIIPIMSEDRCIYRKEKQMEFKCKAVIVLMLQSVLIQYLPIQYANFILWTILFQDMEDIFKWVSQERSKHEKRLKS